MRSLNFAGINGVFMHLVRQYKRRYKKNEKKFKFYVVDFQFYQKTS